MRFARSVSALGVLYIIKDGLPFAGESVFVFGVCVALFCGFARFARAVGAKENFVSAAWRIFDCREAVVECQPLVASGRPFTRMLFALRVGNVILPVAFGGITTVHSITPSVIFHDDDAVP